MTLCFVCSISQDCCQRFHKSSSASISADPQQLIAARYSAFVKKDFKFLRRSSHPDNPALKGSSTADDAGVQRNCSFEEDLAVGNIEVSKT
jgi:SEC-C motif-containing protein